MTQNDLRDPLGRARGLGSARRGSEHWWMMRLTALALIGLTAWFAASLLLCVRAGDYASAQQWLGRPWNAGLMALLLAVGFHHAASGVQTVIEDYVHYEALKQAAIIAVKFLAVLCVAVGLLAIVKISVMTGAPVVADSAAVETLPYGNAP